MKTEADVVDHRRREQRGDARRRPQLVRGAQFVVQPQAGVALPHRRQCGAERSGARQNVRQTGPVGGGEIR